MSRRPLRPSPPTPPLSPLLGQPGYLISEEKLPLANHMLKVTAFVVAEQVGSGEVNVPTCKLTAISSLIRESVCFYKGPSFCVCMYMCHGPQQCVSQCIQSSQLTPALVSSVTAGSFYF